MTKFFFSSQVSYISRYTLLVFLFLTLANKGWSQLQIVRFDLSALPGGTNNFGPSPQASTSNNSNVTITGLTRGSGLTTSGSGSSSGWGANGFSTTATTEAAAITANDFATFAITVNSNEISLSNIAPYNIRRSSTGPATGIWQYQINSGSFIDIGSAITWGSTTSSSGNSESAINLSGISALQNIAAGTTITFRIVMWGATGASGTWYLNDQTSGTNDLIVNYALNAGDIGIVAFGPSGTDRFDFVLLKDIIAGTAITFTDNGFASATTGYTSEGYVTYTAPSNQCAGTVITWTSGQTTGGWAASTGSLALNAGGEQLFAFEGTPDDTHWSSQSGITVLYGIQTKNTWKTSGTVSSNSDSYQPSASVLPAADLIEFTSNSDFYLTATTLSGSPSSIITSLTTEGNFTESGSAQTILSYTSFTVSGTPNSPVSGGNATVTYDAAAHSVTASVGALQTVDWYDASTNGTLLLSGNTTSPTKTAAGTYNFYAQTRSTCNSSNISSSRTLVTLTISPKSLSITAPTIASKTYDGTTTAGAVTTGMLSGFVGTQTVTATATAAAYNSSNVGTYTNDVITYTLVNGNNGGLATNYSLANGSATGTITAKGLTITANNQTKCSGITFTFAGTEFTTNGLVGGTADSVTSVTLTSVGATSAATVTGSPYSIVPSAALGTGLSNYSITYATTGTLTVNANSWIGGNSNWSNTSNWSCGVVPNGNSSDVTISSGSPILDVNIEVRNLSLANGTTLGIGSNTLTIDGAVSSSVTATLTGSSTSNLVIAGAAGTLYFTSGSQTLYNLTLNNTATATLGTNLNIAAGTTTAPGTLTIGSGATLNTSDDLTLLSDNNSTAMVVAIPENASGVSLGTINGKVTIQRDVHSSVNVPTGAENGNGNIVTNNGLRAWRLLTAPVSNINSPSIKDAWQNGGIAYTSDPATHNIGTLITGANTSNGLDYISSPSLYTWDNSSAGTFTSLANTLGNISNGNYGGVNSGNSSYFIFIRGDRNPATIGNPDFGGIPIINTVLNPKGNLITGRQIYSVKQSVGNTNTFTLIGNPYASAVNFSSLTTVNVLPKYYIWDPNLNSVGGFVVIDYTGSPSSPVYSPDPGTITPYLQSSQAFFVVGGTGTDGSVTFDESNKANANNNFVFRPVNDPSEFFRSDLYLQNADSTIVLADGNIAQYNNSYSGDVDQQDVIKFNNINESLALMRSNVKLAIERRPTISDNDTLFLNLQKTTPRNYQFQFTAALQNHPGLTGYLKDSYTGTSTQLNLNSNTIVNFTINTDTSSQNANRFMIVFKPLGIVPVTFTNVKAWTQTNNDIAVQWNVTNQLNIKQYEVERSTDGITFVKVNTTVAIQNNTSYNWIDNDPVNGNNYYRIKSIGNDGAVAYTQIVKVNTSAANSGITVYPNPVTNGTMGLQLANMPAGIYNIRLLNNNGQQLLTKALEYSGGSISQTIQVTQALAKGIYQLEIVKPDSEVVSISVFYQ